GFRHRQRVGQLGYLQALQEDPFYIIAVRSCCCHMGSYLTVKCIVLQPVLVQPAGGFILKGEQVSSVVHPHQGVGFVRNDIATVISLEQHHSLRRFYFHHCKWHSQYWIRAKEHVQNARHVLVPVGRKTAVGLDEVGLRVVLVVVQKDLHAVIVVGFFDPGLERLVAADAALQGRFHHRLESEAFAL